MSDESQKSERFDSEMRQYVDAFKVSSDHSRIALYLVIVATLLVAIAQWNIQPIGTPTDRIIKPDKNLDKEQQTEYKKQYISHVLLTSSPIPGVSIDVNDLDLIGSGSLMLLMLVLSFCLVREHENLFLAFYRVRLLNADDGLEMHYGQSRANLLYHALVMNQVLSSPPTLARWERSAILNYLGFLVFFLPTGVSLLVLWQHWHLRQLARLHIVGSAFLGILFTLSIFCCVYSFLVGRRWKTAFFSINRRLRYVKQPRSIQWHRLRQCGRLHDQIATRLIDSLHLNDSETTSEIENTINVEAEITGAKMDKMIHDICEKGEREAKKQCDQRGSVEFDKLVKFDITDSSNILLPVCSDTSSSGKTYRWIVKGRWRFQITHIESEPEQARAKSASQG